MQVKIVAWNVNHRTVARKLTTEFLRAVAHLDCDVLFLSEYVAGSEHDQLEALLADKGLVNRFMTPRETRQNQMLCASRFPFQHAQDWSWNEKPASLNHVAIYIESFCLTVIGHRVPEPPPKERWLWIRSKLLGQPGKRTVFLGDFNADPSRSSPNAKDRQMIAALAGTWVLATVSDAWSFQSSQGKTSFIDHTVHTPDLCVQATLIHELGGLATAGPGGLSDHRPLSIQVRLSPLRT